MTKTISHFHCLLPEQATIQADLTSLKIKLSTFGVWLNIECYTLNIVVTMAMASPNVQ